MIFVRFDMNIEILFALALDLASMDFPWPPDMLFKEFSDKRDSLDLIAQQDMAFWAKWMFFATILSVLVGALGTAAVVISISYTRLALDQSKKANELTEEAFNLDMRPWVIVDRIENLNVEFIKEPDGFKYIITGAAYFKNVGKSPAQRVRRMIYLNIDVDFLPEEKLDRPIYLAPGEEVTFDLTEFGKLSDAEIKKDTGQLLTLDISIEYTHGVNSIAKTTWFSFLKRNGDLLYAKDLAVGNAAYILEDPHHSIFT